MIQVSRLSDGRRKVTSLSEVTGMEGETITMQEIFRFKKEGMDENNKVIGHHEATGIRPKFLLDAEAYGIKLPAELFRPEVRLS